MRILRTLKLAGPAGLLALLLGAGPAPAMGSRPETAALDVNSVAADPGAYHGAIKVRGVVAEVSPGQASFVLIDIREYKACGVVTCASKFVPVHYPGPLPQVKEELAVLGEMASTPQGYVLEGQELQRLEE